MTLAHRVTTSFAAATLGHILNALWQFLAVRLFLSAWGSDVYGEWLTLYALVAYSTLLDAGWTLYVTNRLTASHGTGDRASFQQVLDTAIAVYVRAVVVLLVVGFALVWITPLDRWLELQMLSRSSIASVAVLLLLQLLAGIPQGLILGVYRSTGEFARGTMLTNAQFLLLIVATAIALWVGATPPVVAALQVLPVALIIAAAIADLRVRQPWLRIRLARVDWRLASSFLFPSLAFMLVQLSLMFTVQGSILIVNARLGAVAVVMFATARTLANVNRQFVNVVNHVALPELVRLNAVGADSTLRSAHRLMVKVCLAVTAAFSLVMHFAGRPIIQTWTDGRVDVDQNVIDLLLAYAVLQAFWLTSSFFLMALQQHRPLAFYYFGSAALGLLLASVFIPSYGLAGLPLGLLVAESAVCGWFVPQQVCRRCGDNVNEFLTAVVGRGLLVLASAWLLAGAAMTVLSGTLALLTAAVTIIAVTTGLGLFVWLSHDERAVFARMIAGFPGHGRSQGTVDAAVELPAHTR